MENAYPLHTQHLSLLGHLGHRRTPPAAATPPCTRNVSPGVQAPGLRLPCRVAWGPMLQSVWVEQLSDGWLAPQPGGKSCPSLVAPRCLICKVKGRILTLPGVRHCRVSRHPITWHIAGVPSVQLLPAPLVPEKWRRCLLCQPGNFSLTGAIWEEGGLFQLTGLELTVPIISLVSDKGREWDRVGRPWKQRWGAQACGL